MIKLHKPYGERPDDGKVQVSFTVQAEDSRKAEGIAKRIGEGMNLFSIEIAQCIQIDERDYFFVLYARMTKGVEFAEEEAKLIPDSSEIPKLNKKLKVLGACTGSDAHTVGLDAILNMKGFSGHKGLEAYEQFEVINLGSQVANEELIRQIKAHLPFAILISQVITHNDLHIRNLTQFMDMLEAESLRNGRLLILGGPRITNELALELGFDKGFGSRTTPTEVAHYIASAYPK